MTPASLSSGSPKPQKAAQLARDYLDGWLAGRADDPRVPSIDLPMDGWYAGGGDVVVLHRGDGAYLGWPAGSARSVVRPSKEMLLEFVNLRIADDKAIADFGSRWGELNLCQKHALPVVNGAGSFFTNPVCDYTAWKRVERTDKAYEQHHNPPTPASIEMCEPLSDADWWRLESADAWRAYANAFGAIVALALAIKRAAGDGAELADVELAAMTEKEWAALGIDGNALIRSPAETLEWWINAWLAMAGVRLGVGLQAGSLSPRMRTTNLFAGLMAELLSAVAAPGGLALCTECGHLFSPGRRPNRSRRVFCTTCSESGAPEKWAARDYKARKKQGEREPRTIRSGRSSNG